MQMIVHNFKVRVFKKLELKIFAKSFENEK